MKLDRDLPENVHDFVDQISNTKSHIQRCIKFFIKETNKNKLDYGQLRYIFRRVREECGIEIKANKKSLYELPNREQMNLFYSVIRNPIHTGDKELTMQWLGHSSEKVHNKYLHTYEGLMRELNAKEIEWE